MVLVKICGITTVEDAHAAVAAGADWIGLNFFPKSRRYVTPEKARAIVATLPDTVRAVGVFVNCSRGQVEEIAAMVGVHILQFHGDESEDDCRNWSWPVIRAIRVDNDWSVLANAGAVADYLLVDRFVAGSYGGTGQRVDWKRLATWNPPRPLVLAGGLDPTNVAEAVRIVRPFAVDVASGVEVAPGRKDPEAMRRFVRNAKSA